MSTRITFEAKKVGEVVTVKTNDETLEWIGNMLDEMYCPVCGSILKFHVEDDKEGDYWYCSKMCGYFRDGVK